MASVRIVKEVIWRGAWLLVRLTDEKFRPLLLNATIKIFSHNKVVVFGQVESFIDPEDQAQMIDISATVGEQSIPDRIDIRIADDWISLPITKFGLEEDAELLRKVASGLYPTQNQKELA